MRILSPRGLLGTLACLAACLSIGDRAAATGVPLDGFFPLVGIALTDEFVPGDDAAWTPFVVPTSSPVGGNLLGTGGTPYYDIALLDTGAGVSLLTEAADAAFDLEGWPLDEETNDGFRGGNSLEVTGATGSFEALINDPLGLYASGLQGQGGGSLVLSPSMLKGQTNTTVLTPQDNVELPNIVGLSYASQYATFIRNDQPQIFQINGQTVRTPAIEFNPLGSGGQGIVRRAELNLNPSSAFATPPLYLGLNAPLHEDPFIPTGIGGGLYLEIDADDDLLNNGDALDDASFLFDTGASVTVLSQSTADDLGFDVLLDEPEFTLAVFGSGGLLLDVPGFFVRKFTIKALGGDIELTNVPVIVLNTADPADSSNIIDGIVGTNLLAGRNVVIDPKPASQGGIGPQLYIGNSVTTQSNWNTAAASAAWNAGGSWSSFVAPNNLTIANLRHFAGGNQEAVAAANSIAWELNVSGTGASQQMTLRVPAGAKVTTFAGLSIEQHGRVQLESGSLDVQYVSITGGRLSGNGSIATGSGPLPGQVENVSGVVAPGNGVGTLSIEGRFSNSKDGTLEIEIGGSAAAQYDHLDVIGQATLNGLLTLSLVNLGGGPFVPAVGNSFNILTANEVGGQFAHINYPALPADRMWTISYTGTAVVLKVNLAGDFNGNGVVNSADLPVWKTGYGPSYDGGGFLAWQRNFNGTSGPVVGVPEPGGAMLAAAALIGAWGARRRCQMKLAPGQ